MIFFFNPMSFSLSTLNGKLFTEFCSQHRAIQVRLLPEAFDSAWLTKFNDILLKRSLSFIQFLSQMNFYCHICVTRSRTICLWIHSCGSPSTLSIVELKIFFPFEVRQKVFNSLRIKRFNADFQNDSLNLMIQS